MPLSTVGPIEVTVDVTTTVVESEVIEPDTSRDEVSVSNALAV